ncbi:MAG: hypothetical protein HQ492_07045 [Woeseiaceae bacterium]|nr:hypothetical protein [Woeseiaceae bacterium]
MDTSWIQIFILTLSECVAPAGKTVCQEQQFELRFFSQDDCTYALEQLIATKEDAEYVIVNRQKSGCAPSAAETKTYASLDAINDANKNTVGWRAAGGEEAGRIVVNEGHSERLSDLMSCEETGGVVPCRVGDIIVEEEATGDSVDVWKRD